MPELLPDTPQFKSTNYQAILTGFMQIFSDTVAAYPEKIAVTGEGYQYTYTEVSNISNQAAQHIQTILGSQPKAVGLMIGHNPSMANAMLGGIKSGHYSFIMDPSFPEERQRFLLQDTDAKLIIADAAHTHLAERFAKLQDIPFVVIDHLDPGLSVPDIKPQLDPDKLFQILYTSGSTGEPKGVLYNHRIFARSIAIKINSHQLGPDSRSGLPTLFSFGGAYSTLLGSLLTGGTTYFYDFRSRGLLEIKDWINKEKITHFQITGTVYRQFLDTLSESDTFPSLKLFRIGGEKIYPNDLSAIQKHLLPNCVFAFGLACSETHSIASHRLQNHQIPDWNLVPVGFPQDDITIHLWDENNNPVDEGEAGEIVVEGDALALGYLNDPELTRAKFLPSKTDPQKRLYKMGDLGKFLPNGMLVHLGRIDHQLKIRGVRIEPEGIENILSSFPGVRNAAVAGWSNPSGEKKLVAYLQTNHQEKDFESRLREFVRSKLPSTMWPTYFVYVDDFPRTPNGKLDRLSLPEPDLIRPDLSNEYIHPHGEIEPKLVQVWEKTIGIQGIGVEDKFFDLGGDSLTAAILFVEIEEIFQLKLPLSILMKAETIRQQAKIIASTDYLADWSPVIPIQLKGTGAPIFCLAGKGGNPLRFRMLAELIGTSNPIYFLQSRGLDGKVRPFHKVPDIAADYLNEIKRIAPTGPYHLIGSSFGGLVAYEIASRLPIKEVGVIALLDTFGPGYMRQKQKASSQISKFSRYIRKHLRLVLFTDQNSRKEYFRYYKDFLPTLVKKLRKKNISQTNSEWGNNLPEELLKIEQANLAAARRYQPPAYPGKIILFRAKHQAADKAHDHTLGWGKTSIGNLIIHEVNSHHGDILFHPAIQEVYNHLKPLLEEDQLKQSPQER